MAKLAFDIERNDIASKAAGRTSMLLLSVGLTSWNSTGKKLLSRRFAQRIRHQRTRIQLAPLLYR